MRKQTMIWKSKDGTKVRVCDMSDRHLANAVSMMKSMAGDRRREIGAEEVEIDSDLDVWADHKIVSASRLAAAVAGIEAGI